MIYKTPLSAQGEKGRDSVWYTPAYAAFRGAAECDCEAVCVAVQ